MIPVEEKDSFRRIASLSAWAVADHYGCSYSGDANPIEHGGFFYDPTHWDDWGYAPVVEFWTDPEDSDVLHVQRGTIHRPKDMEGAWGSLGIDADDSETRANVHAQIDAVRGYHGIEVEGTHYPDLKSFRLPDWAEWRIWRSIDGWLKFLGPDQA